MPPGTTHRRGRLEAVGPQGHTETLVPIALSR